MRQEIAGFRFLKEASYACGGATHTVAEYTHELTGMEFVLIPGGSFMMGSNKYYYGEGTIHKVNISPFLMAKNVVTQKVWKKIMGTEPWTNKTYMGDDAEYAANGDDFPVQWVSWDGKDSAKEFCQKTGLFLPSEAEWEYAARAGTQTQYYWGDNADNKYLWHRGNSGNELHEVEKKLPNAFGLYDMLGNIWQWCEDGWHRNWVPAAVSSVSGRALRGGCFWDDAENCRCARRDWVESVSRGDYLGFRCCFKLDSCYE